MASELEKYNLSNTYKNGYEFYGEDSSSGLGKYNKQYYLTLRKDYNSMKDSTERDFMFLTLVIYAFNHQIRFNSNGEYNMPVHCHHYGPTGSGTSCCHSCRI